MKFHPSSLIVPALLTMLMLSACAEPQNVEPQRHFIAHRAATLRCTLAGENSLEAVRFAARAGFDCVETDVRYTKDSVLMAIHDATLTRAFTYNDGSEIPEDLKISDLTYRELTENFIFKATKPEMRTRAATLEEFLTECRDNGLLTFVEPKEPMEDWIYEEMLATSDKVFGRGNYIITSNNNANDHIRFTMGISDITLMGVLYQTTYPKIDSLGNVIVAVSTTRFSPEEYFENVEKARADGHETESHADNFENFNRAGLAGVDYISTDLLAPDYHGQGNELYFSETTDYEAVEAELEELAPLYFGGIYMEITWTGTAEVELRGESFKLPQADSPATARHQLMLFDERPHFAVSSVSDDFKFEKLSLRVVEF